jgi:hypothetical protein
MMRAPPPFPWRRGDHTVAAGSAGPRVRACGTRVRLRLRLVTARGSLVQQSAFPSGILRSGGGGHPARAGMLLPHPIRAVAPHSAAPACRAARAGTARPVLALRTRARRRNAHARVTVAATHGGDGGAARDLFEGAEGPDVVALQRFLAHDAALLRPEHVDGCVSHCRAQPLCRSCSPRTHSGAPCLWPRRLVWRWCGGSVPNSERWLLASHQFQLLRAVHRAGRASLASSQWVDSQRLLGRRHTSGAPARRPLTCVNVTTSGTALLPRHTQLPPPHVAFH